LGPPRRAQSAHTSAACEPSQPAEHRAASHGQTDDA
jgi:hypothetical protein